MQLSRPLLLLLCTGLLLALGAQAAPKKKPAKADKEFELECLTAHNKWRRKHRAPELVFDKKIAAFSQKRADHIAASDGREFKHPKDLKYGENLAWHSRASKGCDELVKMWYDEVNLYEWAKAQFKHETGHFSQLVWRNTERVGCARALSSGSKGGVYLVCNYDPAGNWLGEERDNVLPLVDLAPARGLGPLVSTSNSTSTSTSTSAPVASSSSSTGAPSSSSTRKPKDKRKRKKNRRKRKKNKKKRPASSTTPAP